MFRFIVYRERYYIEKFFIVKRDLFIVANNPKGWLKSLHDAQALEVV